MTNWLEKISRDYQKSIPGTIQQALTEDIGAGDLTTLATIPTEAVGTGTFTAKSDGIIAGLAVVGLVFQKLDHSLHFVPGVTDGEQVTTGTIIATIEGQVCNILSGERTALNFLQRMSGIATATNKYVKLISHTKCKVLDTRKTVPGLRFLDKLSVKLGGGENHRMGLFDMVLIKDNHIEAAGGVGNAMKMVRKNSKAKLPIEIEVKTLKQLDEALPYKPDRIMLDNMSIEEIKKSVKIVNGKIPLEASGNINLKTVKAVAETGVDYISIGKLTHSVTALDISFLLTQK